MSLLVELVGRCTTTFALNKASITSRGALVVAPYAYDEVVAKSTASDDVPINFFPPLLNKRFVITAILLTSDSDVVGSAITTVYEGTSLADTVVGKLIMIVDLLKNSNRDITGLNIIVGEGKFVNLKADDTTVSAVITGYYVPAAEGV